jgi:predicted Zn-dependent protease
MNQVRGIYVVGTPYQAMSNIIQTSDQFGVFNGVCGAESGFIPSTQRTPHALISSLEVNRIPSEAYEERKDVVVQKPKL